MTGKQII